MMLLMRSDLTANLRVSLRAFRFGNAGIDHREEKPC
jgi:hypothetical protein